VGVEKGEKGEAYRDRERERRERERREREIPHYIPRKYRKYL
jgi:hypothetical protein